MGLVNTAVGLGIIWCGLRAGLGDYSANALGYAVGLACSYLLNRRFTFAASDGAHSRQMPRFLAAGGISYLANLGVLTAGLRLGLQGSILLQFAAMCTYTLVFFCLSRLFVFAEGKKA